jgi:hypothetical protein
MIEQMSRFEKSMDAIIQTGSFDSNCKLCPKNAIEFIWYAAIGKSQSKVPQHGMARE